MSSGKVKCTCGWSWNKSDSSKKDMYICHECGRDNSNNMKNGGWLDSYADGGTMQEHQENYNDPQVSLPEGFVGMGNNTKGRNYSPAWGGQFQNGGPIKPSQKDYKTKGEYNAALKSYNVNLHKYELANNPERLKGESAKDYETRTKYFNFKIRQEQDKDPITKSYLEMKDDQETATNPVVKTLRQVFTSPAHVAHGIYNAANPKDLDKYKSRATKNDEDLDLVNSSLDAASLLIPFDSGMKADALWKQALIRTAKEVVEDGVFNTAKKANQWLLSNFQGGGSVYPVNYVPQAQNGKLTFLQPTSEKLPEGYRIPYSDPSSERAMSIGGENGEPAYLIPSFKYGKQLYNPIEEFKKTGEHLGGPFKTYQEAEEWERTVRHPAVEKKQNIMFPQEEFAMGGSLPGATGHFYARYEEGGKVPGDVGFDYPRTINPAPDNGPGAKKTMASAQNGQEMKYYQEGLDFKPKTISKNGGWLDSYDVAQTGTQVKYGTPEYEEAYNRGEVVTDEGGRSPIQLDEVVVKGKPLTEFGKTRKEIAAKNTWEQFGQRFLGNFEKNMGQTLENLPESRKQEYEDYINKLAFDEYIKTHPQAKGEKRGAYIDRMQAENVNSSNFERAYEANADYNDATDVNKWRKGLIGLGSLVLPKPAMDYMKQKSDYFSEKEKQSMIDNPISTQVGDVLGTIEPLTIPVEGIYGNKSFGDIASGQSANIPMTARILGDPLMLGFEAAPLIMEGVKGLRGASTVAKALSEESAMSKLNMIDEAVASKPWSMEELPGLHLQSTMDNGAISKIVEPKSGLINTEQALAIIGKESGGSDKVSLIKQGLGESIPKKMDYNEFRKVVQDQLIPLDTQVVNHSSNYGISSLGYPSSKRSSFEMALNNIDNDITNINNQIEITSSPIKTHYGEGIDGKDVYSYVNEYGVQYYPTETGAIAAQKYSLENLNNSLNIATNNKASNLNKIQELPLENKTFVFGNKEKFGRGSNAHGNPDETLGHAHYLIDPETPDVLTVTQIQSDAFQGTHRIMPKNAESAKMSLSRMKEQEETLKNIYANARPATEKGLDIYNKPYWYELPDGTLVSKEQYEIGASGQTKINNLAQAEIENFSQKALLDKNHQERFLQEIVANAAERGDVNKVRLPTSETAANVQGYKSNKHWNVNIKEGDEVVLLDGTKGKITDDTFDNITEITTSDGQKVNVDFTMLEFGKSKTLPVKSINNTELKEVTGYMPEHQTILKKYKEQPKLIKKLFGEEPTIVTDGKGNTWYEFNIPKNFKEGKGQIKAFKEGGIIDSDRGQWDHPGKITRIKGGNITMKKDPKTGKALTEPLLGIADTGEQQWMYPEEDYNFEGANYVTEIPKSKLAKNGLRQEQKGLVNLDNLLNFTNYNTKQPGGWLDNYN